MSRTAPPSYHVYGYTDSWGHGTPASTNHHLSTLEEAVAHLRQLDKQGFTHRRDGWLGWIVDADFKPIDLTHQRPDAP